MEHLCGKSQRAAFHSHSLANLEKPMRGTGQLFLWEGTDRVNLLIWTAFQLNRDGMQFASSEMKFETGVVAIASPSESHAVI